MLSAADVPATPPVGVAGSGQAAWHAQLEIAVHCWQDAAMDNGKAEHEARALAEVVERLVARFPDVAEDRVREIVRAAHEEFANRPIRDYVPVFVERTAQDELNRLTTT